MKLSSVELVLEKKRIKRLIRAGKLPRYHFKKDAYGKIERTKDRKLTWRLKNTMQVLIKAQS